MALNDPLGSPPTSTRDTTAISTPATQPGFRFTAGVKAEFEAYSTSATPSTTTRNNHTAAPSPSDYAISPPLSSLDTSSIDPSLLPSPNQNPNSSVGGQGTGTGSGAYAQAIQSTYAQNPYQEIQFPFQNAPGMGFLNGGWENSAGGEGGEGEGGNGGGGNGFSWTGDLGMGMGWEGQDHDFSEGGNGGVDLFDGFFFGGTGNF